MQPLKMNSAHAPLRLRGRDWLNELGLYLKDWTSVPYENDPDFVPHEKPKLPALPFEVPDPKPARSSGAWLTVRVDESSGTWRTNASVCPRGWCSPASNSKLSMP